MSRLGGGRSALIAAAAASLACSADDTTKPGEAQDPSVPHEVVVAQNICGLDNWDDMVKLPAHDGLVSARLSGSSANNLTVTIQDPDGDPLNARPDQAPLRLRLRPEVDPESPGVEPATVIDMGDGTYEFRFAIKPGDKMLVDAAVETASGDCLYDQDPIGD